MLEFELLKKKIKNLIRPLFNQLFLESYPEDIFKKEDKETIFSFFSNDVVNQSISNDDIERLTDEVQLDIYIKNKQKSILMTLEHLVENDPYRLFTEKSKIKNTLPYLDFLTELKKELYEKKDFFISSLPDRFTPFQVWTMTHGLLASYFVKDVKKSDIIIPKDFSYNTISENLFAIYENPDNEKVAIFYGISDKNLKTAKNLYDLYIQQHPNDACSELLFPTSEENSYNNPLYTLLGMVNAKQQREHWIITWVNKNREANCIDSKNISSWFIYSLKNIAELFPTLKYHFRGEQALLDNQKCGYFVISYIFHLLLNRNLSTLDIIDYKPAFNSHLKKLHIIVSFAYSKYEELSTQYPDITFKDMLLHALKIDVAHLNNVGYTLELMSKKDEDINFEAECEQIENPARELEERVLIVETDEQDNLKYYQANEQDKNLDDSFSDDILENYSNLPSETVCAFNPKTTSWLYNGALKKCSGFFSKQQEQALVVK